MKVLPATPDLERVAQRTVWFKAPADALADGPHFVAQVFTYGRHEDVETLRQYLSDEDLRDALEHAPAGVFDPRSWAYWRAKLRLAPAPLPRRAFPDPQDT